MFWTKKINDTAVMRYGFLGGILEAFYCFLVVLFMSFIQQSLIISAKASGLAGFLLFLLVFVFSAAASGLLLFGYPVYLALQQRFAEALMTAATSLLTMAIIGILVFILISFI